MPGDVRVEADVAVLALVAEGTFRITSDGPGS